jgi:hypothetical protein
VHASVTGTALAMDLWGFFIFLWSLFHNARQHYGFARIYAGKSREAPEAEGWRTTLLYAGIVAPQVSFLVFQKGPLALAFFPRVEGPALQWACWAVSALAGAGLVFELARDRRSVRLWYALSCAVFYAVMFYGVAPREPFLPSPQNGAQRLMLLAVMNSLFHNIQYHAIVWHYSQRRYRVAALQDFGVAAKLNGSGVAYAVAAVVSGLLFGVLVWGLGDWPALDGTFTARPVNPVAFALFLGVIGQHFFLDQYIWKPSQQPELRGYLGLEAAR